MLEHVSVPVKSYERSKAFYVTALQPLGYVLQRAYPPEAAGFMEGNHTSFWISRRRKTAKKCKTSMRRQLRLEAKTMASPGDGRAMAMRRSSSIPTDTTSKLSISRKVTTDGGRDMSSIGAFCPARSRRISGHFPNALFNQSRK